MSRSDVARLPRMRDHLAHHYFDTDHVVVRDVVDHDLGPLADAAQSLVDRIDTEGA